MSSYSSSSTEQHGQLGKATSDIRTDNEKLVVRQKINTNSNSNYSSSSAGAAVGAATAAVHQKETALKGRCDSVGSGDTEDYDEMNINGGTAHEGVVESPVLGGSQMSLSEERLRRKLQFFFMNPIEKWQAKRRFPYKFVVQVIKIVLVTLQLCLFAHSRYMHVNYTWDNTITFSHMFLRGWDITMEVSTYPPETGPLSVYAIDDFFKTIDYAIDGYANLSEAIGPYSYPNEDNTMLPMAVTLLSRSRQSVSISGLKT